MAAGTISCLPVRTKWLVLWSLWTARLVPQLTAPVLVSNGWLRGQVAPDGSYVQYMGIPYATVGERFQAPKLEPTWEGVYDAVDEHIRCQQSAWDKFTLGTKHCLILNVYTPVNTPPDAKLPVMFYIHGGGFFQGSTSQFVYGPKYLVAKDVILVTITYRLNIQGFLCLRIKEAPGNAGMKDQVAALKWVKRNIRAFGGDPDNVTLFGESAGAAAVSFHVLSPMSKGLFHKAITQSGSSLAPWAYQFKPVYLASLLAKTMNYETQDPHKLYQYFSTKTDGELILTRVPREKGNVIASEILYSPCSEAVIDGEEPFLTESPIDVLSKGTFNKVPMIIGSNTEEGLFLMALDDDTMLEQIDFHRALPKNIHLASEDVRREIGEKFKEFYSSGDKKDYTKLARVLGEPHLAYPPMEEAELIVRSSNKPVFSYIFNYAGRRNIPKIFSRKPFNIRDNATHADEVFYLFSQTVFPHSFEHDIIEKMTTMWTNFAKHGDPTPETSVLLPVKWLPVELTAPTSLLIDTELSISPLWYSDSFKYLKSVYAKYRRRGEHK